MSPVAVRHVSSPANSTEHIVRVLLALSLAIASVSVMATLSAMYWLILLLIRSDFLKTLVFVVFPIVSFAWGSIPSDSAFCQISGFTLAVGIESSDVAVLLIALHSAMYIFRPRSGLYPYRRLAYLVFYLYPLLAASLAFLQGNGYENMGHFCYLRTDRSWERLALSWIPRYIIFAGIVVIYAFIYLYIRRRMGDYGRRCSEDMQPSLASMSTNTPPVPPLCYNGLITSTPSSRRTSATDTVSAAKESLRPSSSTSRERPASSWTSTEAPPSRNSVRWNWTGFTQAQSSGLAHLPSDKPGVPVAPSFSDLLSPPAAHTHRRLPATSTSPNATPQQTLATNDPFPPPSDVPASSLILAPPTSASISPPPAADSEQPYLPTPLPGHSPAAQQTNRKPTLRQLRSLFIYPLAYTITWLFPFISHILGYNDDSRAHHHSSSPQQQGVVVHSDPPPPHWLLVVSLASLCVQGAVDCGVFMARETPWRFEARGRGFWAALWRRWGWNFNWEVQCGGRRRVSEGAGRSREEMLVDGRLARERREAEVKSERERGMSRGKGVVVGGEVGREWWDVYTERVEVVGDDDDVGYEDWEVDEELRQEVG
ncbi:hypothetical protein N657DRAFT_568720 [Parathielavia appendiculata]|uniref:Uncharacterized protein n=1 Tax=Parathielavia appendiculata TaxID=2587402 RepID=A0AAN6U396_9PEZI|nr:hypothetical protein N657DRAFT_568720 [Parathielavia appendiculata]